MRRLFALLALSLTAFTANAGQPLDCDALIEKIAARLESKGIENYELKAVPIKEAHPGKKVGTCAMGSMKVMYIKQ